MNSQLWDNLALQIQLFKSTYAENNFLFITALNKVSENAINATLHTYINSVIIAALCVMVIVIVYKNN